MKHDTPRDGDGNKLCAWCGEPIRQSGVGRSRDYCRRSCRQRAYEARQQREAVVAAVAAAVARRDSSRVETRSPDIPSRDETNAAGPRPVPAQAADSAGGDFLLAPPAGSPHESPLLPDAWRASVPRRRLSRNRAGMQAQAIPLWRPEGEDGESDAQPQRDGQG